MNKFVALATAGAIALVATLSVTAPSQAFYPKYGFAAGVVGFMAGAAIASAAAHDHYWHDGYGDWDDHVDACYSAYRTYSASDDRYTAGFDSDGDAIRVRCKL